jgi:drug/metabolite transporter (DMT)-like permease
LRWCPRSASARPVRSAKALIEAGLSPLQAVWLRIAGAALVLVPVVLAVRGARALRALAPFWPQLAGYGLAGLAGCQACYFVAASRLPIGVAILLEFTGPVLVLVWIRLVRRTRVPPLATAGIVVALVGLACVVEVWSGVRLDTVGLLAGFGAAACQAAGFLLIERLTGDVDPLALTAVGGVAAAAALTAVAVPWTIPWRVLTAAVPVGEHTAPGWLLAAWITLISTVLAYVTCVAAVQRLSAPIAGAIGYTEAVVATLLAWAALGERLTTAQLIGGAIVLTGAFIAQRAVPAPAAAVPAPLVPAAPAGAARR